MSIKVLICDDQELARAGIRFALEATPEIEIVGEADGSLSAGKLTADLQPDVVLMDVVMPDDTGVEATRRVLRGSPRAKVLAVSMHTDSLYVAAMMEAGASGYVDKSCAYEELAAAIHEVMAGRKYLSPSLGTRKPPGSVRRISCPASLEAEVVVPIASAKASK